MPLVLTNFGPIDDILLPGVGLIDDLPTLAIADITTIITTARVNKHR